MGSLRLDCNTKALVGQPCSVSQATLGDSLGFLSQVDYKNLRILRRFQAHEAEVTRVKVFKYKSASLFTDILVSSSSDNTVKVSLVM